MFQKGEYVVYGNLGVCRVNDLVTRQFEGLDAAHPYYVLEPVYQGGTLYAPADILWPYSLQRDPKYLFSDSTEIRLEKRSSKTDVTL